MLELHVEAYEKKLLGHDQDSSASEDYHTVERELQIEHCAHHIAFLQRPDHRIAETFATRRGYDSGEPYLVTKATLLTFNKEVSLTFNYVINGIDNTSINKMYSTRTEFFRKTYCCQTPAGSKIALKK